MRTSSACAQWMTYIRLMQSMHLGAVDLNLLVVLDALLTERNVTKAAARIGITQSATSHALARLRVLTGDELLVRGRQEMLPTMRGEALAGPVRRALDEIARALAPVEAFDPKTTTARVTLGTSDYGELVLLPRLAARLAREAPNVDLRIRSIGNDWTNALASAGIDLVFAPLGPDDQRPGLYGRKLFEERFVCVVRKGHPLATKKLTLKRFVSVPHALIAPGGREGGFVDDALARLGMRRRVAVAVPHFLIAPHVVASTDLLLTLASRVAAILAAPLGLAVLAPPPELATEGFTISAIWHERTHGDPLHRWLRDAIAAEAASI
ncbi:MAG TPA: LysR family transcriptional regulator [Polyangiaceae bacterium]|jgi:DNA-binding transcriptional LysR family regulator|nr:LysR family transcriptional regulator [Polyangiaceae bacterium]